MGLEIKTLVDAIHVKKEDGTKVNYYLFDEYEIHLNTVPANTKQVWHYHQNIEEVILITKGELDVYYIENNHKIRQTVKENQLVLVKDSIHTFINNSDQDCLFVVFRLVLDGINKRELIKKDKIIVDMETK